MRIRRHNIDLRLGLSAAAVMLTGLGACSNRNGTSQAGWDFSSSGNLDSGSTGSSGGPGSSGSPSASAGSTASAGSGSTASAGSGQNSGSPTASAQVADAAAPVSLDGYPTGADKIVGVDFLHRIVGTWAGINTAAAMGGLAFPMIVDFEPSGPSFVFGRYDLNAQNNVLWGFNIETYGGKDVLAFRNGGYLAGFARDSRLQLTEYNASTGYYRFCAVLEHGIPVDGCNYIDARYTFTGPDAMTFDVMTQSGKSHILWQATRVKTPTLPNPFPASVVSQGPGSAPWPGDAGL